MTMHTKCTREHLYTVISMYVCVCILYGDLTSCSTCRCSGVSVSSDVVTSYDIT